MPQRHNHEVCDDAMAPPPALRAGYVKSLAEDMSVCHRPKRDSDGGRSRIPDAGLKEPGIKPGTNEVRAVARSILARFLTQYHSLTFASAA